MVNKKARGKRAKTRQSFKAKKQKLTINKILTKYNDNDRVQVNIDSRFHSGLPHKRFQGIVGTVIGSQGIAKKVALKRGNKSMKIIIHPVHLKKI